MESDYAGCFQEPTQPAPDGAVSGEEEDGHTEARKQKTPWQCALLLQCLGKLKLIYNNEQESSNYQTQQEQVGTGNWVRLMSHAICLLTFLSIHRTTSASTQPLSNPHSQPATDLMY